MMEQDAAPAGGVRTPALGRPGTPSGGHYDRSARSSLDWDWRKCLVPGSADPGPVPLVQAGDASRDGAPRGARTFARGCGY